MPLVRYEIRNEYSHANPELYKAAAKDDPQRLLEGVAMAGLVGIVRQLGDMAEFAAELFHKLHEEVMATAARGHDLLVRVQQLEAEIPAVEKSLLSVNNQLRFVYASGVEWHANIHNNQNHLTQGDLPWFIRSSYEECRAPPRLFILDKFDVAGAGACLKRYTDPSFFRMEWASSELMKAEKEQRDKQAQRIKKKRRRRRNGEIKEGTNVSQTHPRVRYSSLDATFGIYNQKLNSNSQSRMASNTPTLDKIARDDHWQENTGKVTPEFKGDNVQPDVDTGSWYEISNGVADSEVLRVSEQSIEVEGSSGKYAEADTEMYFTDDEFMDSDSKPMVDAGGDDGSDAEQFVDALTTMDSEVETDTESKVKLEIDSDFNSEVKKEKAGKLSRHNEASEGHIFDAEEDLISIQPVTEILEPIKKTDSVMSSTNPVKTEPYAPLDEDDDLLSVDEDDGSSAPNTEISVPISEDHIETGSIDQDSKVPQSPELSSPDHTGLENMSGRFHFRPGPAILLANGVENGYLHSLGSLSYHRQAKSTDILTESNLIITEEKGSDEPESGLAKSPEEFSPRSSTESIILQPLQFTTEYSNLEDISDDNEDMDGVQVSSGSSSFSSSTLSSPRFTLLTTTTFHVVAEADPKSPPSNQLSTESSLTSPISNALHSPMPPVKLIPVSSTSSESQPQSLHFELLQPTSRTLNSSITMADLGELPPRSPPLPPLQWRIIKPQHSSPPSAAKPMVPPPPPAPPIPPVKQDRLPSVVPAVKLERRDSVIKAIVSHDKSRLENITKQDSFPIQKPLGNREVLLEQIRTRSFSLRHTVKEKNEGPRSITNINVAAILEKANAIRQAFAGSDDDEDDDDWSDASNHI